jgi:hypothetical protein
LRLKIIDEDLGRRVQVPAGIGLKQLHMAVVALGLAAEELVSTLWLPAGGCGEGIPSW